MLKSLTRAISIAIVGSSLLVASSDSDKLTKLDKIALEFEKRKIPKNRFKLNSIEIVKKIEIESAKGWSAYVFDLELSNLKDGQKIETLDFLFTNGEVVAPDLIDINTKRTIKDTLIELPDSYYDDKHFIAGSKDAKHKLVIFSDPLCPFCLDLVPDYIDFVKKHSKEFGLYYYHFPILAIHPAAETIIKAQIVAEHKGIKDSLERLYKNGSEFENPRESDREKILKVVNRILGTKITTKELDSDEVKLRYKEDIILARRVMVAGTPTIFLDGKKDSTKSKHEELIK